MATESLDDLIDHLLDEVALCGESGASPKDCIAFIHAFYDGPSSAQTVDHAFLSTVWQWLIQNPHINFSGTATSAPTPTLSEAEAASSPPRLFTTQSRIWLAITGHEPSSKKVHPSEIALLSIIASRKSAGILQTELVKLSGQDKRSVPKRTDALAAKGYIDKRTVLTANARTSLCVLKRFAKKREGVICDITEGDGREGGRMIDLKELGKAIVDALREKESLRPNVIKEMLGCSTGDAFFNRHILFTFRRLQYSGCVQKLKGYFVDQRGVVRYSKVLRLLREPTEAEWQGFQEPVPSTFGQLKQNFDFDDLDSEADEEITNEDTPTLDAASMNNDRTKATPEEKVTPAWTPDRSLPHIIFDLVDQSGTCGISTMEVTRRVAGPFFRRAIEITLSKLSDHWQSSQPLHLRHLAIIKDTAITNGLAHYTYYTYKNFQKLVDSGARSWEAVTVSGKQTLRSKSAIAHPIGASPELDDFGFPKVSAAKFMPPDDHMLLEEYTSHTTSRNKSRAKKPLPKHTLVDPDKPRGRPRKYPASGIPQDIERWKDQDIRRLERSRNYAFQYVVKKAQDKRDSLIADGIEPLIAEKTADKDCGVEDAKADYEALLKKLDEFIPLVGSGLRTRRAARGRPKKDESAQKRQKVQSTATAAMPYLPSIVAHSSSLLVGEAVKPKRPYHKRKRDSGHVATPVPKRARFEATISPQPTALEAPNMIPTSRSGRTIVPTKRLELDNELAIEGPNPTGQSSTRNPVYNLPRIVTREEQLAKMPQGDAEHGCCAVGELFAKTPKGGRGRPRKSQLLVFRLERLKDFSWFKDAEEVVRIAPAPAPATPTETGDASRMRSDTEREQRKIKSQEALDSAPRLANGTATMANVVAEEPHTAREPLVAWKQRLTKDDSYHVEPSVTTRDEAAKRGMLQAPSESTAMINGHTQLQETPEIHNDSNPPIPLLSQNEGPPATELRVQTSALEELRSDQAEKQEEQRSKSPDFSVQPFTMANAVSAPTRNLPVKSKKPRLTVAGGSIALLRRNIVMDLVNQCNGVSPDTNALSVAFSEEWSKRGQSGKPDGKTCKNAVKGLIDSGALQRFQFGFQTPQGVNAVKGMLVLSGIDRNDERVKGLENKMTALYPNTYYPEAWDIGDRGFYKTQINQEHTTPAVGEADISVLPSEPTPLNRRESILVQQQRSADREYAVQKAQEMLKDKDFSLFTINELKLYEALVREAGPAGTATLPSLSFRALRKEKKKEDAHAERTKVGIRRGKERLASIVKRNTPVSLPSEMRPGDLMPGQKRSMEQGSLQSNAKRVRFAEERGQDAAFRVDSSSESDEPDVSANTTQPLSPPGESNGLSDDLTPWEAFNRHVNHDLRVETKAIASDSHSHPEKGFVNYLQKQSQDGAFPGIIDMEGLLRCTYSLDQNDEKLKMSTQRLNESFSSQKREVPKSSQKSDSRSVGQSHRWVAEGHNAQPKKQAGGDPKIQRRRRRPPQPSVKFRRITELQQAPSQAPTAPNVHINEQTPSVTRVGRSRKSTIQVRTSVQNFGEENTSRLMVAVSIIRCLTGGMKQHIDWSLVETVFPGYDQQFLNQRWRFCKATYRLHVEKLLADFQEAFVSAYEAGEVFTIDLDHPESIDWKSLTDWAMQNVEGSAETGFLNLPRERETLDRLCVLEPMSQPSMATFFEQDATSTIARRKTNLYAQAWGPPLLALPPSSVSSGDETPQFCILKSWIRANVIASEETYSPISAREKLSVFPTPMIEIAIKQMLESHILSQETKGKINPGRNYDISATVLKQLKKAGNAEKLKAAIEFKVGILDKVLIPDSGERGEYMVDCLAHDHIALVILNLIANKRCIIRPVNPPREKWGLCGDGDGAGSMYQTRKMDKRKLNFTVGITATGEYVVGALDLPQPPRSTSTAPPTTTSLNMPDTTTLFPLWTDIHENHVPALWDLSVAAVFNTLAQRPGCNPAAIAGVVKPALEDWEVELILEWGEEWGGVQRVSLGASGKEKGKAKDEGKKGNEWRVGEWWWAALGVGAENIE